MAGMGWCKRQRKGIRLIEPNPNLCKAFLESAEETLRVLKSVKESRIWSAAMKYYCEYFVVYALMMRVGIKCEIHDCTIETCKLMEKEKILEEGTHKILETDKKLRIENQYYLKNIETKIKIEDVREFLLKIKRRTQTITLDEITRIREKITNS